jgi:hypothetical protein
MTEILRRAIYIRLRAKRLLQDTERLLSEFNEIQKQLTNVS